LRQPPGKKKKSSELGGKDRVTFFLSLAKRGDVIKLCARVFGFGVWGVFGGVLGGWVMGETPP